VVFQRVDTYWGQTPSKYGKLPVPKYIAHRIFSDRDSEEAAFKRGEVDVSQQFIPQVGELRESNPRIKTYLSDAPYYLPATIPFLVFNTKRPGLDELAVRKAIAMSLDYHLIGQKALSNYTAPMAASLMLPNPLEQSLIDADALKPYQWQHGDVEGANALLDQAGWVRSPTGIRTKGGVRLSFTAECPIGSFDGQTTLEIISQSSKAIGIDIKPTVSAKEVWQDNQENGTFDMTIHSYGGPSPASPWNRAYQAMDSADLPPEGIPNPIQNWGRWINPVAQDLIARLILETDPAVLTALWTQLNILYLQNLPCVGLMYRPLWFHTVNTSVWEGFPQMDDGSVIPPTLCTDGYGIRALYKIKPKT
jgi:peptide/nickel transport system substrate-binding protein